MGLNSVYCIYIKTTTGNLKLPKERLNIVLASGFGLDELYLEIINRTLGHGDAGDSYRFRSVMWQILTTQEPLSISSLEALRGDGELEGVVRLIVQNFGSLVNGTDETSPVRLLHTSLRDFLTGRTRSGDYCVDESASHKTLALAVLRTMTGLKVNMCQLETSYLINRDIPDLDQCVTDTISPHLSYSSQFWMKHLRHLPYNLFISDEVKKFLGNQFLF